MAKEENMKKGVKFTSENQPSPEAKRNGQKKATLLRSIGSTISISSEQPMTNDGTRIGRRFKSTVEINQLKVKTI